MGKQGPCCHCGVTSTPLWRNGPPDKPVLCNACGSRWRTKGSLVNYTPLHARAEPDEFEDRRVSRVKTISIKNKDPKLLKRKQNYDNVASAGGASIMLGGGSGGFGGGYDYHNSGFRKGFDEDTSNRSSSGSAMSNSDGCMQIGSADASDLTGPSQSSVVWDTMVPSRKRTCFNRLKQSPVEKLTQDLHTILHEQQSYFSGSSEEDLIFESDTPMVSVEIGHGSVLIRHPNSTAREEESEASSVSVDTKNEAYSRFTTLPVYNNNANKGGNFSSRAKKPVNEAHMNRDNEDNLQMLKNCNSPLLHIDLKDVINFEEFKTHMTNDEQQQLLKYLNLVDTVQVPDSLKSMFDSPQFKENLSSFQKLLSDGVFDLSSPTVKNEGLKTLKKLALCSATKSNWVEKYNQLQGTKCKYDNKSGSVVGGASNIMTPGHSVNIKRPRDAQFQPYSVLHKLVHLSGPKTAMKSPKRPLMKSGYEHKEVMENDGPGFSPRSLFALPPDHSLLMLDSLKHEDENGDQDLLLDVPSNTSFPQAELLLPKSSLSAAIASTSSSSIYQNFGGA